MPTARRATQADLPTVTAITDAAYRPYIATLGDKPLPMTTDHTPLIEAGNVWLIDQDGDTVALAVLEPAPDHLIIFSLAVLPTAQGAGLGQWLLHFAETRAHAEHRPELRLYTSAAMTRNLRVYAEAGFEETGRRPHPSRDGWTLVDMAKRVAPKTRHAQA